MASKSKSCYSQAVPSLHSVPLHGHPLKVQLPANSGQWHICHAEVRFTLRWWMHLKQYIQRWPLWIMAHCMYTILAKLDCGYFAQLLKQAVWPLTGAFAAAVGFISVSSTRWLIPFFFKRGTGNSTFGYNLSPIKSVLYICNNTKSCVLSSRYLNMLIVIELVQLKAIAANVITSKICQYQKRKPNTRCYFPVTLTGNCSGEGASYCSWLWAALGLNIPSEKWKASYKITVIICDDLHFTINHFGPGKTPLEIVYQKTSIIQCHFKLTTSHTMPLWYGLREEKSVFTRI